MSVGKLTTREFNKYLKEYTLTNKLSCPICGYSTTGVWNGNDRFWSDDGKYAVSYVCPDCDGYFYLLYALNQVEYERD